MRINKYLLYLLAFLLGVIVVFASQFLITKLWNIAGISWGPSNLPHELTQQLGMLISAFIAGALGPCVSFIIVKSKPVIIIVAFLLIGLSIDLYASLVPLKPVALWFRIAWVVSVPIQIFVGYKLADNFIGKNSAQQRV